ncbi:MAG TPA: DUF2071 domain-containing protein [Kofleriaceae bacterium]|nr:DUF2071 domain-containing protein [Kofleriaceae bacterium]
MGWALLAGHVRFAAFVNYDVDRRVLEPLVPAGTELDTWEGRALVSLVAFEMTDNRLLGVPLPFARAYDQINLRFYVRRPLAGGSWRRGVVFLRELVPVPALVAGARLLYRERYERQPVSARVRPPDPARPGRAVYRWRRHDQLHRLAVDFTPPLHLPEEGTLERFLSERHWGYASPADDVTREYRVEHPPWRIWQARAARLSPATAGSFGHRFERALAGEPAAAFVAEGSRMRLHRPHPLAAAPAQSARNAL